MSTYRLMLAAVAATVLMGCASKSPTPSSQSGQPQPPVPVMTRAFELGVEARLVASCTDKVGVAQAQYQAEAHELWLASLAPSQRAMARQRYAEGLQHKTAAFGMSCKAVAAALPDRMACTADETREHLRTRAGLN